MSQLVPNHGVEIFSLNIDDLDVAELERRLEMAVASTPVTICASNTDCSCGALTSCTTFCK